MPLVVDASVAVKFVVREPRSEAARHYLEISDPLIGPDWLLIEAASALWRKVKRSELLSIHAERNLEALPEFFERLHPARELVGEALAWGFRLQHSVYDCLYLALALREDCGLVTDDEEFHQVLEAGGHSGRSVLLPRT